MGQIFQIYLSFLKLPFLLLSVSDACLSVYHMSAWCSWSQKEGTGCPGSTVAYGCEPSC